MKKLVLNLGLATLTVLPIVAVASCSATTPEAPSLTTEVAKYKNPFTAKDTAKTMTSLAAIATIKGNNTEKLTALQNLVTLQLDNTNFTYTVENAVVGSNDQTIDVTMKITEKASSAKSETVKVVINGFSQATSPLDIEAKRFQTSIEANTASKSLTAASVIKKINDAEAGAKLTELQKFATVPEPNTGFTIQVVSAQPGATETSVAATIKVTQTEGGKSVEATFTVTGFSTTQSVIQAEAAKLVNNTVLAEKATETAEEASKAINATTLVNYYAQVTLSEGFSYTWKSNEVIGDTVKVTVTVSSTDTSISSIEHSFIISGFKKAVDVEAARFNISLAARSQSTTTRRFLTIFNELATTQDNKMTALEETVANVPALTSGFTLAIGIAAIVGDQDTSTSATLSLTINQTGTQNTAEATLTITGLGAETLQQQIQRLADANLVTKPVLAGKEGETAQQASGMITNLESLTPYYTLIPLPKGFQYNYVSNAVENENLKVTITVSSTVADSNTSAVSKDVVITGFKTQALIGLEEEAKKLVDQQTRITGQTAFQAKAAITNDATLTSYYATITVGNAYGYNYGGKSEVDKTDPTKLNVTLRIRIRSTNQFILKVVQITGFNEPTQTDREALKFQTSLPVKTPGTLTTGIISVINAIDTDQTNKLAALKGYVENFPTLGEAYTLTIGSIVGNPRTSTSVDIPITVSPKQSEPAGRNSEAPATVTFTITGLTIGTPKQQLEAISKLLNNRTVKTEKQSDTASVAKAAITSDGQLNLYYQNTRLPQGFSYFYGGKSVVNKTSNTTLDVTLRIVDTVANLTIYKVVEISGFASPTTEETEAQKFAISLPAKTSGTLTSAVITGINTTATSQTDKLTALQGYVNNFPDTAGFALNIGTVVVDPTNNTSVLVPITVTKNAEGAASLRSAAVTFIITDLTAPSASK